MAKSYRILECSYCTGARCMNDIFGMGTMVCFLGERYNPRVLFAGRYRAEFIILVIPRRKDYEIMIKNFLMSRLVHR